MGSRPRQLSGVASARTQHSIKPRGLRRVSGRCCSPTRPEDAVAQRRGYRVSIHTLRSLLPSGHGMHPRQRIAGVVSPASYGRSPLSGFRRALRTRSRRAYPVPWREVSLAWRRSMTTPVPHGACSSGSNVNGRSGRGSTTARRSESTMAWRSRVAFPKRPARRVRVPPPDAAIVARHQIAVHPSDRVGRSVPAASFTR